MPVQREMLALEMQYLLELRQREPKVLNSVRFFNAPGFYNGDKNMWLESLKADVLNRVLVRRRKREREPVIFLLGIGGPGSGKSTILGDMVEQMVVGKDVEDQHTFMGSKNLKSKKSELVTRTVDWGGNFPLLNGKYLEVNGHWVPARVPEWVNYHDDNSLQEWQRNMLGIGNINLGEWKRAELEAASQLWRVTLEELAGRYYYNEDKYPELYNPHKVADIVRLDHPGYTGEGPEGFDRATGVLRDFINHQGSFEDLNYIVVPFGVVALPHVLMHNQSQRPEDRAHAHTVDPLNRDNIIARTEDERRLVEQLYIEEAASRQEIQTFDRDKIIGHMMQSIAMGMDDDPEGLRMQIEAIHSNLAARQQMEMGMLLPDMFQRVVGAKDTSNIPIMVNCQVHNGLQYSSVAINRPTEELQMAGVYAERVPQLAAFGI